MLSLKKSQEREMMGKRITDSSVYSDLNGAFVGAVLASATASAILWVALYIIYRSLAT